MARESVEPSPLGPSGVADTAAAQQLAIRVLADDGNALPGIGVEVRHGGNSRLRQTGHTDGDGWARFRLAELVADKSGEVDVVLDVSGGPAIPFRASRRVRLGGEHVFILPPLAQIALQVHGGDDHARAMGTCGVVQRQQAHGFGLASRRVPARSVPSRGERTHFFVVANSGPLDAFVALPGEQFETWLQFVAPPTGETLLLDLILEQATIRFRGRAKDATGALLADTSLSLHLNIAATGEEPPYWEDPVPPHRRKVDGVTTDDAGRFHFALGPEWLGFAPALFLGIEGATQDFARVDLPLLQAGERDLGEVLLGAPPIGAGRVVDGNGVGIEGAFVLLYPEEDQTGVWDGVVMRARTRADGAFVLPGPEPRGRLRLDARADGYRAKKIAVDVPLAWDYRIELVPTRRIAGQLAAENGSDLALLRTRVQPKGAAPSTSWRAATVALDGSFAVEDLDEGLYSLEVTDRFGNVVFALADVEAHSPGVHDPRLSSLDLGPSVGTFTLRATGPGGAPLRELFIAALPRGAGGEDAALERRPYASSDGEWRITTRAGSFDAVVTAPGYRPETLRAVARDHTVELRPAPLLPMRIRDLELPLPDGIRVVLHLGLHFSFNTPQGQAIPTVDGVAMAPIPTSGSYYVSIHVLDDLDPQAGPIVTGASNDPFPLDPDALPAELLVIPDGGFEKALERARAR